MRQNGTKCVTVIAVVRGTVMQYHAGCQTSTCRAYTVFSLTLAASGAAFKEQRLNSTASQYLVAFKGASLFSCQSLAISTISHQAA